MVLLKNIYVAHTHTYIYLRSQKSLFSDLIRLSSHQGWGNGGDVQEGKELPQDLACGSEADPPRQALNPAKP